MNFNFADTLRVLAHLRHQGDGLAAPRDVFHYIYFNDAAGRDRFKIEMRARGFAIDRESFDEDAKRPYGLTIGRVESNLEISLMPLIQELLTACAECDAEYDGWETAVVKSE